VRVGYLKIIRVKITGKVDASWDVWWDLTLVAATLHPDSRWHGVGLCRCCPISTSPVAPKLAGGKATPSLWHEWNIDNLVISSESWAPLGQACVYISASSSLSDHVSHGRTAYGIMSAWAERFPFITSLVKNFCFWWLLKGQAQV
jgi:hypothetical protein